ncbi:tetratricopeptide repeat protein [Caldicellulosiruptor changbaiensis]|uniref:tetratricopeptide repeat protein n=1 Tax=Caldicellulosiruptor changbaiensis TaxID=1222016 RepID=UPI001F4956F2|nr:tetratricopeptide repeat protein [Caldicellulosiruptor changbaiensis]
METRSLISFCIDRGDYEKAKELIFSLLKEHPHDVNLYLDLAFIEIREKNLKKAEDYAKQALNI